MITLLWHANTFVRRVREYFAASPARFYGLVAVGLVGWYLSIFVLPHPVSFAYGAPTCTARTTLLPALQRQSTDQNMQVQYDDTLSIGSWPLISTKTCFTPLSAPSQGDVRATTSLFGTALFGSSFTVRVAAAPAVLHDEQIIPVAVTKPLTLPLTTHDEVFGYTARVEEKSQRCAVAQAELSCRLDTLDLDQGQDYTISIERSFAGEAIGIVSAAEVQILPAATIVQSSIKPGAVVYDMPPEVAFETNKQLKAASVTMRYGAKGEEKLLPVTSRIDTKQLVVVWDEALPREQRFELVIQQVEAQDGSALAEPYVLEFTTSGGPKVQSVDIGSSGVALGAVATITFDQPLAPGQALGTFASIAGGSASIYQRSDTQISFRLHSMPSCSAFTLKLTPGLIGANTLAGTETWAFTSRTSCRIKTEQIGQSVKGRAITAYYYGAGAKTILFMGGIHGSEPSGVYLMQDWIAHLDSYGYKLPANTQVVVVPDLNPDGTAVGERHNANDVNLARNFPSSDWATDVDSITGILPGAGGSAPLSEPEAAAIAALTRKLKPRLVVNYHARGSLVGINDVADSRSLGTIYAGMVGYGTMFDNAEEVMGYSVTGEYETWIGEELGKPAILIELPGYHGRYFWAHRDALWRMVNS